MVPEDTNVIITGTSVADADAATAPDYAAAVTVKAGSGVVTLGSKDGLAFGTGDGVEDELMQFVGVLPNVNAALASLTYRGLLDFNGADNITITVSDQTHRGTGPALTDTASQECKYR